MPKDIAPAGQADGELTDASSDDDASVQDVDNHDRTPDASTVPSGADGADHRATLGATEREKPAAVDERRRS